MTQVIKTVAAVGVLEAIAKTSTADCILDEATKKTEEIAKLLKELEKKIIEMEENKNDFSL